MDAVEFLRDFRRMCKSYGDTCDNCKLEGGECSLSDCDFDQEKVVRIVEEWAKVHPATAKTRLSEFLKLFPNALVVQKEGCPGSCVKVFDSTVNCEDSKECLDCKKKFWLTPIEEEKE